MMINFFFYLNSSLELLVGTLYLILMLMGLKLISVRNSMMLILIMLEFIMLTNLIIVSYLMKFVGGTIEMLFIFLLCSVMEATLGISLLVKMARSKSLNLSVPR